MMPSRVKEVHACMKKHERGMEKDRGERERERETVGQSRAGTLASQIAPGSIACLSNLCLLPGIIG